MKCWRKGPESKIVEKRGGGAEEKGSRGAAGRHSLSLTELLQIFKERLGREVAALHRAEEEHPGAEDRLGHLGLYLVVGRKGLYP